MGGKGSGPSFEGQPGWRAVFDCKWSCCCVQALPLMHLCGALICRWRGLPRHPRSFWISTLATSLTANFISLNVFGQTPVLHMPQNIPPLHLSQYWIYLFSWSLFRGSGPLCLRNKWFSISVDWHRFERNFPCSFSLLFPIFACVLILPIGYFLPQILGGGNQLVLDLGSSTVSSAGHDPSLFCDPPFYLEYVELW